MSLAEEMEAWTAAQGKCLIIAAYQGESDRVSAILAEPFFSCTSATGQPATGRPTTGSPLTHYISIDWADKEGQVTHPHPNPQPQPEPEPQPQPQPEPQPEPKP